MVEASRAIAKGENTGHIQIDSQDELGKLAQETLRTAENIKIARNLLQKIGQGDYELNGLAGQVDLSGEGIFASLVNLQNQLRQIAEADEKRNWVSQGLAEFGKVLRADETDIHKLAQRVLNRLANYIEAHHGGLFVLNDAHPEQIYLELVATYGYDSAQYESFKALVQDDFAEGLIGQVYLEKEPIYFKNVKADYFEVSSALGQSKARSILVVPLLLNDKVEGVIELAALKPFAEPALELVNRLSENIASAILSIKVGENTRRLLQASQELTHKLQTQEKELRQNYEELKTTQEEVGRQNQLIAQQKTEIEKALAEQTEKSEMLEAQEEMMRQNMEELVATQERMLITQAELDGQLNAINQSQISKAEYDMEGNFVSFNESFCVLLGYTLAEMQKLNHRAFTDRSYALTQAYEDFWNQLRQGLSQSGEFKIFNKMAQPVWVNAIYSPVFDEKGLPHKVIQLAFDISESKKLLRETQTQAQTLRYQEAELRQNMEELKLTQAELNRQSEAMIQLKEEEARNARLRAREIENKNQLITSSIQYAQNIQSAILPPDSVLEAHFQEHFVVYLPKDIVSGDFYWFSHLQEKTFIAAVDCTGHGVPGAFMSIIGNTLLNEIVNVQHIYDPGKILENLHLGVRTKLRQAESSNQDGMDIALCVLERSPNDPKKVRVLYAGAKRPLYYYHQQELHEVKGDRKSIGGWQQEVYRTFATQELFLPQGDYLYLSTDGLADNPNARRKKFGVKKFRDIILKHIHQPLSEQGAIFEKAIREHQLGAEQRDDITLLGLRI
ncbi:MAG: SpoIIE family protein phosphatase [Microscillaceae bacterium]|nr:SpoIIE family protein phosphatase [Microscillaceae bacterium]